MSRHGGAMARPVYLQQRTYLMSIATAVECQKPPLGQRSRGQDLGTPACYCLNIETMGPQPNDRSSLMAKRGKERASHAAPLHPRSAPGPSRTRASAADKKNVTLLTRELAEARQHEPASAECLY